MMAYSFNLGKAPFAFAHGKDINASYKDLGAVCDAIRYLRTGPAIALLDEVIGKRKPVPYRRHNKYMGSRYELGGAKGAYPLKAAREVKTILVNAMANSVSKGMDADELYVVHAMATKTHIERRQPPKGSLSWGRGRYGRSSPTHSDIEYARIEIGLGRGDEEELSKNMKYFIRTRNPARTKTAAAPKKAKAAPKAQPARAEKKQPAPAAQHDHQPEHQHPHDHGPEHQHQHSEKDRAVEKTPLVKSEPK
jgi:large subunit ribosomal protein L22